MEDNSLLVIVLAFVLGCMCSRMMKQMCGQRLVEGNFIDNTKNIINWMDDPGPEWSEARGDTCYNKNLIQVPC
tara:strand:- start:539 stop:757 length:219 start_codon:yes stop_codon:yes gene_type:complete